MAHAEHYPAAYLLGLARGLTDADGAKVFAEASIRPYSEQHPPHSKGLSLDVREEKVTPSPRRPDGENRDRVHHPIYVTAGKITIRYWIGTYRRTEQQADELLHAARVALMDAIHAGDMHDLIRPPHPHDVEGQRGAIETSGQVYRWHEHTVGTQRYEHDEPEAEHDG